MFDSITHDAIIPGTKTGYKDTMDMIYDIERPLVLLGSFIETLDKLSLLKEGLIYYYGGHFNTDIIRKPFIVNALKAYAVENPTV